jgi:hypothetical protein
VVTAATPLTNILNTTSVGPGALFWGLDPAPGTSSAVARLSADPSVTRLLNAAQTGGIVRHPVFFIGMGVNLSFFITGGVTIGFLIGTGPNPYTLLTLVASAGAITNVGLQAVIETGVLWEDPKTYLKFGCYMQVGGGEFIQGSLGAAGNFPLHLDTWDNCGPALNFGIGLSISPVDIGFGVSYTWQMARL